MTTRQGKTERLILCHKFIIFDIIMANLLTMGVEMTRLTLSENEVTEFTEMVNKFKAYSKPSNRQKELIRK